MVSFEPGADDSPLDVCPREHVQKGAVVIAAVENGFGGQLGNNELNDCMRKNCGQDTPPERLGEGVQEAVGSCVGLPFLHQERLAAGYEGGGCVNNLQMQKSACVRSKEIQFIAYSIS